ncbi:ATP-dependent helicase HrpB [Zobellella taiwanensis]|uniref:ATP-dependent helicase HrpB n=1 Tax=Zobellella taiwanensis TaxID=347535 RepID=A0A2P7QU26_9GAMM|nr:ATP-dependent helicase HrpB [Zobellella taiwanensis]PSJ41467.1 ATP-dependent helicase HrpB [Zobellella taiwanensis]
MNQLPITEALPRLQQALASSRIILEAPPGAGKSTWLPLWLLERPEITGRIIMLEPRRLAARTIAQYLARQLGEAPGGRVGYRMRGESRIGKSTRLEVVTEGVLTRMLQADPELAGVSLLIFDEFHERSLQADLALAFALECQALREDLRILVMSATLEGLALEQLLPDAAIVRSAGRAFPVSIEYLPRNQHSRLDECLGRAVLAALSGHEGSVLAFLPGEREIRAAHDWLLDRVPGDTELRPLYGRLTLAEQQAAIAPAASGRRKVVLATNVAETSLTIDGIGIVVDSGLERQAQFDPEAGITRLLSRQIGQASATQRAGRAGRLGPGVCLRLWSREQQERLAPRRAAEIEQSCLAAFVLECAAWGAEPEQLPLLTSPPAPLLAAARRQLAELGLLHGSQLTPLGRRVWRLGTEPWLGQLLLTAADWQGQGREGALADAVWLAALVEEGRFGEGPLSGQVLAARSRLAASARRWFQRLEMTPAEPVGHYLGLLLANARPEWVGLLRQQGRYALAGGLSADLPQASPLAGKPMLAVAALGRGERGVVIQAAEPITLEALRQYLPGRFSEREQLQWDDDANRVRAERQWCFGSLVLQRIPLAEVSPEQRAHCLLQEIRRRGWDSLPLDEAARQLWLRLKLAGQKLADCGFSPCDEAEWLAQAEDWLLPRLHGLGRWDELARLDWSALLRGRLDWQRQQMLDTLLPARIELATGTRADIRYREGDDPVLPVRLQEMFGQSGTPELAHGRVALVLELLSPARRPLQVTRDLAAFWAGSYQDVKKEMKGRYPKHVWPDDPANTAPTRHTKRQMKH